MNTNLHSKTFFRLFLTAQLLMMLWLSLPGTAQTPLPSNATAPIIPRQLTLAQAEQLLLQRNLSVMAAKYNIDAARAARLIASFKPNPVLTIGAEQLRLGSRFFGNLVNPSSSLAALSTYTFRIDKTIERGGKRELRTEVADWQLKASEAQMLDALRTQMYQLHQAFTSAALAREQLLLAEQTQAQYEQTQRLTEIRAEAGELPGLEVYRAKAGLLQYQQAVQQARTDYQQSARDVLNLLGATPDQVVSGLIAEAPSNNELPIVKVSMKTEPMPMPPATNADDLASLRDAPLQLSFTFDDRPIGQTLNELRAIALQERPDVQSARNLLSAAFKGVSLAQAQRVRDISVGTEFQRVGPDQGVGVVVSIPLFRYNNHQTDVVQAQALQQSAAAQLKQAENQAVTDVEKAYQAYLAARRTLDLFNSQNLTQLEKLRSIAAYSFKEGASSLLELLDAQRSYNQAMGAYNQARADYQMALWQLEQALGRPLR